MIKEFYKPGRSSLIVIFLLLLVAFAALPVANAQGSSSANDVSSCATLPGGAAGWWQAEGDGHDVINGNNGSYFVGLSFTNGETGQGFLFNGSNSCMRIPASGSLNAGTNNGFTVEAWIYPFANVRCPIWEWNNSNAFGVHLWLIPDGSACYLYANVADTDGGNHAFSSASIITNSGLQHVALTYNRTTGIGTLYANGVVVAQANLGIFTPQTSYDVWLGLRPSEDHSIYPWFFYGIIDEITLYKRSLLASEIQSIFEAGVSGKCYRSNDVPATLVVSPSNGLAFSGFTGGPFSASNQVYALDNIGDSNLDWTLSASANWIDCSITNGTLGPGATTNIIISLNSNANVLAVGSYSNALAFVNITSRLGDTERAILLTVLPRPPCAPLQAGAMAWWRAEGNGSDRISGNDGIFFGGLTFTNGEIGQGFLFNGSNSFIRIPASEGLNAGTNSGFTVEAWLNRYGGTSWQPVWEWNNSNALGAHLWFFPAGGGAEMLWANVVDTSGGNHVFTSPAGVITNNSFQHLALTYDKTLGMGKLYANGILVAQSNLGVFTPQTSYDVWISRRPTDNPVIYPWFFSGVIDEITLYKRALSSAEIQSIYNAGAGGKCGEPPMLINQPFSQFVPSGSNVLFNITATSSVPVIYQWQRNGTNLASGGPVIGANNANLMLSNCIVADSGEYSVMVSNVFGAVFSTNAVLLVFDLHHFVWNVISSPRLTNLPFTVTIVAQDSANGIATDFSGAVALSSTNGLSVTPGFSGQFSHGIWTGSILLSQPASNVVLQATDDLGHTGTANPVNFVLVPTVQAQRFNNTLLIFWPQDSGFVLETTPSLSPAEWTLSSNSPVQIGNQWAVSVELSETNSFYRLRFENP